MKSGKDLRSFLNFRAALVSALALAAGGVITTPAKDAWFTQHNIIMQDFERAAYRTLSADGKQAFQELFRAVRTQDARATCRATDVGKYIQDLAGLERK
jgi:hypothetical protein